MSASTPRVAYVNASSGIAGDMLLGALVDAGADRDVIAATLAGLGLEGWAMTFERVQRGGIAATWANVVTDIHHDHHTHHDHDDSHRHEHEHRPAKAITALLDAADLPAPVRATAHRIFDTLATAEGAVHGIAPAEVEFHEVGALDAIVDVVGVSAALHDLGVTQLVASPVAMGHGTTRSAHGVLPNPPPAVARLMASRDVPIVGVDTPMELSTPTGVAVLVALAERFGALPAMTVEQVGYGAGTADPIGRPNVVQVLVGTPTVESATPAPGRAAVQLEANVDDVTGEVLAHTIAALLAAGAHDAWATPIVMKKGRPAHTVHALADPGDVERVAAVLLAETGSLGVRAATVARWPQRRQEVVVDVDGHAVRVKVAAGRAKPEHDDAATAAAALGRPLRDVLRDAESRALERPPRS
jgi:pyridinium-3,5-bisthiocarboxylic acid mononucleotide nickel chelatase